MSLDYTIVVHDDVSVVSFNGRIISETDLDALGRDLFSEDRGEKVNWVYDLGGLSHINSTGINFIIRSLTRSRVNNGDLVLAAVTGNVRTLFEIAKIHEIITIYEDISDAINHFNEQ
jgi:anti-anti-sigma factor